MMDRVFSNPASHLRQFRLSSQPIIPGELNILWSQQILDPDGDIINRWNHIFLLTSLVSLFIDPLYFYIPFVDGTHACMNTDKRSRLALTSIRTIFDLFYFFNILIKFRTAFVAPSSRVFGRGELIMDPDEISKRYLKSDFIIDLAAMLPLPQFVSSIVIPKTKDNITDHTNNTLALIVLLQYVPRLFIIFPLNSKIARTTSVFIKTAWAGAAYNLLLYMLASHVAGAAWYLLSIGRQQECWKIACKMEINSIPPCDVTFLDCLSVDRLERRYWLNATHVLVYCDANSDQSDFKFGMFADAFTSKVAASNFRDKAMYCLWWGLRSLSSYGQTLETSTFTGETTFCISLCIIGLILFAQLIGNMQTYLSSMTLRLEEWRIKRRDTEEWMRHRQLPPELQERVRQFVLYKWFATRGVDEEAILQSFPTDLRREIQRHQCLNLVRRVPFFSQMNDPLLDAICERLVSSLSTQDTYIVREGDPVNEMLFVIRGKLDSSTTNGGRDGFFNSITMGPGDFCGEELLTWALVPSPNVNLPSSTRTVKALTEVEAFALEANDLKFVSSQFKNLHSKKLQHAFRHYSHQWRTWGSCFIQAAWRRYKRKKLAMELAIQEMSYYTQLDDINEVDDEDYDDYDDDDDDDDDGDVEGRSESSPLIDNTKGAQNIQATFLASKFAANTRRGVQKKVMMVEPASLNLKMPRLLKPDEPDFSHT